MASDQGLSSTFFQAAGAPKESLKQALKRSDRRHMLEAVMLILPVFALVLAFFALPIVGLLTGSIYSPDYTENFPHSAVLLQEKAVFDDAMYAALFTDIKQAYKDRSIGKVGRRLNQDTAGFSTMLKKAGRESKKAELAAGEHMAWFENLDKRWTQAEYQAAISRTSSPYTDFFMLKSVDLKRNTDGDVRFIEEKKSLFLTVFLRTLTISFGVTLICCVVGYPLAWTMVQASPKVRNILLLGVLFPFWTSLLVRTAAWVIVLQKEGPINTFLEWVGVIEEPLTLVFNRFGVNVALTHILLPFLVLPLYSIMKSIPGDYMRAAKSLGARPIYAFFTVYFPQTLPGLSAGAILVFIMSIGYYITPALVGGPKDQMISYFIAFYTNNTINWGLASALALNLLIVTMVLYALYQRVTGGSRVNMGA